MKIFPYIFVVIVQASLFISPADAQPQSLAWNDPLFPAKGSAMVTFSTGVPYIGAGEYAYGFSDRFSVGVLAASAPPAVALGIRIRASIFEFHDNFRIYLRVPIIYYPPADGLFDGEPWLLAWPVMSAEWKLSSGTRLSVGGGVVRAGCVGSLMGDTMDGDKIMGGIWNTFHLGAAVPLNNRLTFQAEASAVMSGFKIAGDDWIARFPAIVVLGFSYQVR